MYQAILVAPDGDYVTDFHGRESFMDVEDELADMGSRWYFYPFHAVITDYNKSFTTKKELMEKRLISVAYPFEHMKGKKVSSFIKMIQETPESELEAIIGG